jgi:hypothetical protein
VREELKMDKSHWNTEQHYAGLEGNIRAIIKHEAGNKPPKDDARVKDLLGKVSELLTEEIQKRVIEREVREAEAEMVLVPPVTLPVPSGVSGMVLKVTSKGEATEVNVTWEYPKADAVA